MTIGLDPQGGSATGPQVATAMLREQVRIAHDILEGTMADVTDAQANATPPGVANPLGATYAHLVASEDAIVQGMLQGKPPLAATSWAGKTGLSEPMPMPGPQWADYPAWARRVKVDVAALKAYAQAVYAATDDYLAGLPDAALKQELDLSGAGLGKMPFVRAFTMLVLNHIGTETGEISVLKGIQGLKGYPF